MKKRIRIGRKDGESEGFVWITFSDLLTTLFMVFMVIALWAIAKKDVLKQETEKLKRDGEQCLANQKAQNIELTNRVNALDEVSKGIVTEFKTLQSNGICQDSNIEELPGTGGFRIIQKKNSISWFDDSQSQLGTAAQQCLKGIGLLWIKSINSNNYISDRISHLAIEGHANSKPFRDRSGRELTVEENFLRNLDLSQQRSFQASKFLIENIKSRVGNRNRNFRLSELIVAQGKSFSEPVFVDEKSKIQDLERSKRLEFKVILGAANGN